MPKMARTRKKKMKTKKNQANAQTGCISLPEIIHANSITDVLEAFTVFKTMQAKKKPEIVFDIQNHHAEHLHSDLRNSIFALFEENMKELYEKNLNGGYDAGQKYDELFHPTARYLLVWQRLEEKSCGAEDELGSKNLCAFVHFRFVEEVKVPIMYLYEIQIRKCAQRTGLGKHLMQVLMLIGHSLKMEMLVLTAFKENHAAMEFYKKKLNFEIDETSPCSCGDHTQSYEILSRSLQQ
uniref:N-alpha-acetyltransferase 40 n=1 Tax=Albugo laibachii Nc14 TaxID=890382 RepID=F0W6P7_9STRA|nr:Nacetyltransferase putative [Albugo laibachii Nc14]|eukprot:CCA16792.1 Nacetyltransferase putative [Albugo laibachii Nc14]